MLQAGTASEAARFFFGATTQHVESLEIEIARELGRAVVALSAVVAWGAVVLLWTA